MILKQKLKKNKGHQLKSSQPSMAQGGGRGQSIKSTVEQTKVCSINTEYICKTYHY